MNSAGKTPFEFGRELSGKELVDREDELALVVRTMQERGRLFLIGPRRFGKTSILRAATDSARTAGMIVLRHDAEAYPTVQSLAEAIVADGARRLTTSIERAGQNIARFFSSLRPQVRFDPMDGSVSISLAEQQAVSDEPALLATVLDGLNDMAAESTRPVAVVVDEFQKVVEAAATGKENSTVDAEAQIRAAVQRHEHVGYVFAGSKTGMLTKMTGDASRPFYRIGARLFLGPIPRDAFSSFLTRGFESGGYQADNNAVTAILELAEDVPYNVQRLAYECWNQLRDGEADRLTAHDVRDSLDRLVRRDDPFYTQTWNALVSTQQKALIAIVTGDGQGMLSQEVLTSHGLAAATMQTAIRALNKKGILRYEETRGSVRYRLEDPFLGAWVGTFVARP